MKKKKKYIYIYICILLSLKYRLLLFLLQANFVAPGKRPFSNVVPTAVLHQEVFVVHSFYSCAQRYESKFALRFSCGLFLVLLDILLNEIQTMFSQLAKQSSRQ